MTSFAGVADTGHGPCERIFLISSAVKILAAAGVCAVTDAIHNAPEREDARNVRGKALRKTAEREMEVAAECEKKGTYGAALLHYREAQKLDPETPGLADTIGQTGFKGTPAFMSPEQLKVRARVRARA